MMSLHNARVAALLAWVNSTKVCPDPLNDLSQLQDCSVFIRIIHKIHGSKEGESVLEQPLPERISFIHGFLQKHCRHKLAAENLVSAQKLLDGEELALAKVAVLLLYHTSMSSKNPGDWNEFDYKTQVELASILKFVLDNEECLNENLEPFLQRKAEPSLSSSSFEEHSPLLSLPHKREVRFLELQRIASFPSTSLPSAPSSPMGDIMQTPQFQLRRLKEQLAFERENREELEVEVAESQKLVMEKDAQITTMQQRMDRLAKLNEKQAEDQLEPKEMEELREKNESLVGRLHEAFRQCQDLKTEKAQMDRKINQLSEENGELSFKLREIASNMVQLQRALNELSEEHNSAMAQSQEKQQQLEKELHAALQDKKCSEEKIEILQGKISMLEDQLAKLEECSTQEKGEVMGDILKLEELKQEVSSLTAKGVRLEEEKQQLDSLVSSLQNSLSESHRAQERLKRDLQVRAAESQAEQLAALSAQHEQTLRERDSALQQLQQANASLSSQLQAVDQEKAALSCKVGELEAQILELGAQRQEGLAAEALKAQLQELEGRLKESQQRLAEREKVARENSRLQEQLLFLEESLRNTEGILEDEKRRAAECLEGNLARIAELEAERQQLVQDREPALPKRGEELATCQVLEESQEPPMGASPAAQRKDEECRRLKEEMQALSQEHSRVCQQLQAEQEKVAVLEAQAERLAGLQADLSSTQAWAKEKESEEQKLRVEISSLKEKMAVAERTAAQRVAKLEADAQRAAEALEGVSQQLSQEKLKSKELEGTADQLRIAEKELVSLRSAVQEKESWKEQVSQCVQEMERKNSLIGSLEHEVSVLRRQVTEKEAESKELKRLILAESEKSKKLEERLRVLQTEMATAASRAAERCSLMKVEVQRCQEEMEKQRMTIEALKRDRHCQSEREDELRQEAKACQDKCLQKEQLLAALQQELDGAQAERASLESQHRRDLEQRAKAASTLQAELAQAKLEAAEVPSLREQLAERDRAVQRLQAEAAEVGTRLAGLQQANAQLAKENQGLSKSRSQGQQQLEAELGQARERHRQELEQLRAASEKLVTSSRQEAKEAVQKLEDLSKEYESSKAAALEERKKLLEAKQRLTTQVEQLEIIQKDQTKQVEELNKKLTQHEKAALTQQQRVKALEEELQAAVTSHQEKVAELQVQLTQKEQAAESYKGQMEKAKSHYDAKKQQNQELLEKLKAMEHLQKENTELQSKSERLAKELQQSILQAKESEMSCKNLTSQIHSLEVQVEVAKRQVQELSKFQVMTTTVKGQESSCQSVADQSTDSLDEAQLLNSTRKATSSQLEVSVVPSDSEESPLSQRPPQRKPSLESLYFTPILCETPSQLESSANLPGDLSLDSGCKTRSARRRTTINITMTDKQTDSEELVSIKNIPLARSTKTSSPAKGRLRSGASTRSLTSFPSQETLVKLETSSPEKTPSNSGLLGLPGYRPVTRSSLRLQRTSSSSLGRNTINLGMCQDEPEQLDDWNRIAELQRRNQARPPHLKTSYPLESMPSTSLGTITDEDVKMGDPEETLRRASMQPSQLMAASSEAGSQGSSITTRQQRKRLLDETHQGPDTPPSKKPTSCFPRPQTTQDRGEQSGSQVSQESEQPARAMQAQRRQSMAFSILNTPRELGRRLLRRAVAQRSAPTASSSGGGARRSSRIATAKSPKGKAGRQSRKDNRS
ncbi:nuclear mitotic apparatus protein 1 isoform X1 [Hirundo rustica]|uniref:nuclear mitotic apparatus protein 1 isoform X1 n=1 Tax=Hirundo rustica TaxID=43150 RepID=UPI001A9531BB|nr:nuclear mitotic apparatus protein 1 isoform X1 [Hirundo rustica]XP_039909549.1 nuclear mitotic apparatus protein 1 isoform X1 [Hirundo rustica]XP_039909557.1 nuclear mitotic apparatus protein 1 isoform X1 [Hirundo rustica]XP_039909564.1 nuclear mitotic apparatus protein 1 isoform X1 [Hirundo rustica]